MVVYSVHNSNVRGQFDSQKDMKFLSSFIDYSNVQCLRKKFKTTAKNGK